MTKLSFYASADKLNPLFQQHLPQGRMQARDYAFFMKKYSFMQQHKQSASEKKEETCNNNG